MKWTLPGLWLGYLLLMAFLLWLGTGIFFTDPYFQWTRVTSPYKTVIDEHGVIKLEEAHIPTFKTDWFSRMTALTRTGLRIVMYRWLPEPGLGGTETEVVQQLHQLRFNPEKAYVITGAHYSDLYVRNLGIFFNELLNPAIGTEEDLLLRRRIALQTVALDLAYLRANGRLVTTIVPLGGSQFTGLNIYAEPSDSLHGVLYTLQTLRQAAPSRPTALKLVHDNKAALQQELHRYLLTVIDPETLVVRKDVVLSGARDGVKRQAAFFDSVIAWKTVSLARQLDLVDEATWPVELRPLLDEDSWKEKIIAQYWQEDKGYFANDLSDTTDHPFGGDSLVAFSTGFLNPKKPQDLVKLQRMVAHIQQEKLDQPFPLGYSRSNTQNEMHLTVKVFAPGYMGEGIWSHWGMEYIKVLLALSQTRTEPACQYLAQARDFLAKYEQNIIQSGGYPELYQKNGQPFQTLAIRSVLHSGWVVNYEAAQVVAKRYLSTTSCQF